MLKYAKVVNQETKACDVGIGTNTDFYKSLGMTEMDVEEAFDGSWYIKGYAPIKPQPTHDEVQQTRARLYQEQVDPITSHISRLRDSEGHEEEKNKAKVLELKNYLSQTDYVSCKLTEALDETELQDLKEKYADVLKKRREARAEINELEK